MREFCREKKDILIIIGIAVIYYMQELFSLRLGINFEEFRDANAYLLSLKGYIPYRDFEWIHGPFSFLIYPLILRLFGINLIVLRISYVIFGSLVIPLSYFLAKRIMPSFWAGIAAFLSIIFFTVPYYTFNHVFLVLGELACLLMVSRFIETEKKIHNVFWGGVFASIALLTKPLLPGIILFCCVSLFLFLSNNLRRLKLQKWIKEYSVFVAGTVIPIILYFVYLYFQTRIKNLAIIYPFYGAPDSLNTIWVSHLKINRIAVSFLLTRFVDLLPIGKMTNMSAFGDFKRILSASFNAFILFLPFMASFSALFIIYAPDKLNKIKSGLKEKIFRERSFLLLFAIFSIFISLEAFISGHNYSRAYNTQVPFILTVYILYFARVVYRSRPVLIAVLTGLLLFGIIFLPFLRYPYSKSKRYIAPLSLRRAKGIFVTPEEKELYESLLSYLSANIGRGGKIAVISYYPQLSFLSEQKNIFQDDEYISLKLKVLSAMAAKDVASKQKLTLIEDRIIGRIERERPRFLLTVDCKSLVDPGEDYNFLSLKVRDYIEKEYYLDKVFGPADVFGSGGDLGWVNLYRLKG